MWQRHPQPSSGRCFNSDLTLEQALALLKEPKKQGRARQAASLKEVGKHPVSEKMITLKSGRYGPYITDGEINASLPRGMTQVKLHLRRQSRFLLPGLPTLKQTAGQRKKQRRFPQKLPLRLRRKKERGSREEGGSQSKAGSETSSKGEIKAKGKNRQENSFSGSLNSSTLIGSNLAYYGCMGDVQPC